MIFTARLICGCCYEDLTFRDEASAQRALAAAGLAVKVTIVDDEGVEHPGIDPFYGLWVEDPPPAECP